MKDSASNYPEVWPGTNIVKSKNNCFNWDGQSSLWYVENIDAHLGITDDNKTSFVHKSNHDLTIPPSENSRGSVITCANCNKSFWRSLRQIRRGHAQFCTKACANTHNKGPQ